MERITFAMVSIVETKVPLGEEPLVRGAFSYTKIQTLSMPRNWTKRQNAPSRSLSLLLSKGYKTELLTIKAFVVVGCS